MSTRAIFFQSLAGSNVDPINGIIRGVAVITGGITAKGHELGVDSITVAQLKECADKMGTVPVKWNHRTGADAVAGFLTNFFIEGNKLVGDWHLLHSHAQYNQAIEMATRMPQNVGLSAAFMGEDEEVGGKTYARCSELISVDLVANPAANPSGLFERRDDGVRLLGRARDADGQFADQTSAGANPASMAAAYSGAAVQRRDATPQNESSVVNGDGPGQRAIRKFRARAIARKRLIAPVEPSAASTEFSQDQQPRHPKLRVAAGLGAGALLGGLAGLRGAQLWKFRPARAGENLAGRTVAVKKSITVGGVKTFPVMHVGAHDDVGRVIHSSPGVGVKSQPRSTFTENGKSRLYVERGASPVDGASVRAKGKQAKGRQWCIGGANCEHVAADLTGRKATSPQLKAALGGAALGSLAGGSMANRKKPDRREFSSLLKLVELDARHSANHGVKAALARFPVEFDSNPRVKRQLPGEVKAGFSGAASGAVLGSLAALKRGTGIGAIARSVGIGAAAGGTLVGGGSLIGSKIIGPVREGEAAPYTKRAAIGGALVGTALGGIAGVAAIRSKWGATKLAGLAKTWRPALWAQRSGTLGAAGIGAISGGAVGGFHAGDEGSQTDLLNSLKKQKTQNAMSTKKYFTRPDSIAAYKVKKGIRTDDLNRRDANLLRGGSAGAIAAILTRGKLKAPVKAAIGGALGAGSVLAIRKLTESTRDRMGDRSRGAKKAETILPVAGAAGVAGLALKRRKLLEQSHEEHITQLAAPFMVRSKPGREPLGMTELARRLLCSREHAYRLLRRGDLVPVAKHEKLKSWHWFNTADLDTLRNEHVTRIVRASYHELSKLRAPGRTLELAVVEGVRHAERSAGTGTLKEFDYDDEDIVTKTTKRVAAGLGAATIIGAGAVGFKKYSDRLDSMRATVPGFRDKPAWGQMGTAAAATGKDATRAVAGGVKTGLNAGGAALIKRGAKGGIFAKLGMLLRAGALKI